uniref:Ion_trans domain-containing protein n=1 Tax=Macrostomum lignano TaxID=282301 RepID=A0A1I8J5P4_9PLAT
MANSGIKAGATETQEDKLQGLRGDVETLLRVIVKDLPEEYRQARQQNTITHETEKKLVELIKAKDPILILKAKLSQSEKTLDLESFDCNKLWRKKFDEFSELSIINVAIAIDKVDILLELVLSRRHDLLPACITLLIELRPKIASKKGNEKKLKELCADVSNLAMKCLDELYSRAKKEGQKQLLFGYIKGSIPANDRDTKGPKFPCQLGANTLKYFTLLEMIDMCGEGDLYATECLHRLIDEEWDPPEAACPCCGAQSKKANCNCDDGPTKGKSHKESNETEGNEVQSREESCFLNRRVKPKIKFYVHLFSFITFNIFFAWYIMDFPRTFRYWPVEFILAAYFLSFTLQEVLEICKRSRIDSLYLCNFKVKCPVYFKDVLNLLDCFALILMWAGLLLKLAIWGCVTGGNRSSLCSETNSTAYQALFRGASADRTWTQPTPYSAYACQMVLSTAFLLWGFRSVAFLSYSERIGPVVSMLRTLIIQDLIPFSVIIVIIFYSFGVFFFNLLYPVVTSTEADRSMSDYSWHAFLQVFMLPLNLLFTNFDVLPTETAKDKDQVLGEVAHHLGYKWFSRVMMFVFLLLSNIVMINLLIARFSLTVSRMDSKSVEIWRKRNVELLREYQSCSPVPAPLSFIHYIYKIFQWCQKRRNNAVHPENTQEGLIEHILSQQQSRKFMQEVIDEDVKRYLNHLVKSATRDMLSDMLKVLQSSVGTDDPAGHIKISGANQTTSST